MNSAEDNSSFVELLYYFDASLKFVVIVCSNKFLK